VLVWESSSVDQGHFSEGFNVDFGVNPGRVGRMSSTRSERLPSPVQVRPRRMTGVRQPFIFRPDQVRRLLAATVELPDGSRSQQRGLIYSMIFALCYGLGLRVGEAASLRLQDVDWDRSVLTIKQSKFGKSRTTSRS
jgi:integrase